MKQENFGFFALMSRMKYIERWALMRNARTENVSEHTLEVAMIAHALCVIGNTRYGKSLNAEKAALIGLYHDASEIITGDMPTPVKYHNRELKTAYKEVEAEAERRLLDKLPEDLRPAYEEIFEGAEEERMLRRLVKAADKFSALIKCLEEESSGNTEFRSARLSTEASLAEMEKDLPEIGDFRREFLPSYGNTLDELTEGL
jgi:5'-deoxynucleotidase